MPLEKRTRVEIFLPVRNDFLEYRVVSEWLAEEFAFVRGGATLTTPFLGLYLSDSHGIQSDQVRLLFCDFDLDADDPADQVELINYLNNLQLFLGNLLREEEMWVVYHPVSRLTRASPSSPELEYTN